MSAGWANTKGKRWYNEDTVYCQFHDIPADEQPGDGVTQIGCFGCFDGHGGAAASLFVRDNLFTNLLNHEAFAKNLPKAVEDAYKETDEQYLKHDEKNRNDDGCTAVTAVVVGKKLVVGHVGDSRAVLGKKDGTAVPLSDDHKPNRPDELHRVQSVGGTVVHVGTWRVGGILAVSRSFGNRSLKQFIIAHPETNVEELDETSRVLILATDGVWDVLKNEDAVEIALRYEDGEAAARAIVTAAYDRGSQDNISSIVCYFGGNGDGKKVNTTSS